MRIELPQMLFIANLCSEKDITLKTLLIARIDLHLFCMVLVEGNIGLNFKVKYWNVYREGCPMFSYTSVP